MIWKWNDDAMKPCCWKVANMAFSLVFSDDRFNKQSFCDIYTHTLWYSHTCRELSCRNGCGTESGVLEWWCEPSCDSRRGAVKRVKFCSPDNCSINCVRLKNTREYLIRKLSEFQWARNKNISLRRSNDVLGERRFRQILYEFIKITKRIVSTFSTIYKAQKIETKYWIIETNRRMRIIVRRQPVRMWRRHVQSGVASASD